jgi:hypothetical protein
MAGDSLSSWLESRHSWDQFEIKIKPPLQAQEWSYSSHRQSIGKVLSSPNIKSSKKAHINCVSSARIMGIVCANEDQIRRQGRWNNTTMNGSYLSSLPREMLRSIAGFPTNGRLFYLARAALDIPFGNIQFSLIHSTCRSKCKSTS